MAASPATAAPPMIASCAKSAVGVGRWLPNVTATEIAERAIGGLKVTVRECDENLGAQLNAGTALSAKLSKQVMAGEAILNRLTQIALAARPSTPEPEAAAEAEAPAAHKPSNAKTLLAAAQAFSERRRATGLAA